MYKYYIHLLLKTNLFKSLFVNFKVFPFKVALRLPILVAWNTHVQGLKNAQFQGTNSFATYKFGFPMDLFRSRTDNTYLDFRGKVVFKGRCSLGKGSKVIVDRNGYVQFGRNFSCTGGGKYGVSSIRYIW